MDEVQVDVKDGRRIRLLGNNVRIPDFFEESFGGIGLFHDQIGRSDF